MIMHQSLMVDFNVPNLDISSMDATTAWYVFSACLLAIPLLCWMTFRYFVDSKRSYFIGTLSFVLCMSTGFLCVLLVPVDIYVISKGDTIKSAYMWLFGTLMIVTYTLVPFAYFYGIEGEKEYDFEEDREPCSRFMGAIRKTSLFTLFVGGLLVCGLIFRPGRQTQAMTLGKEVEWVRDLLDFDNQGYGAVIFGAACLTLLGSFVLAGYLGYGMAAFPFWMLRGAPDRSTQQALVEGELVKMRRELDDMKIKFGSSSSVATSGVDTSRMSWREKRQLTDLQAKLKSLTQQKKVLEELIASSSSAGICGLIFKVLTPFKFTLGLAAVVLSFLVGAPLVASVCMRTLAFVASPAMALFEKQDTAAGVLAANQALAVATFAGPQSALNVLDRSFTFLASYFPLDFLAMSFVVFTLFGETIFGLGRLDLKAICGAGRALRKSPSKSKPSRFGRLGGSNHSSKASTAMGGAASAALAPADMAKSVKRGGSSPFALLWVAAALAQATVALCPLLLTVAPNYSVWGSQSTSTGEFCSDISVTASSLQLNNNGVKTIANIAPGVSATVNMDPSSPHLNSAGVADVNYPLVPVPTPAHAIPMSSGGQRTSVMVDDETGQAVPDVIVPGDFNAPIIDLDDDMVINEQDAYFGDDRRRLTDSSDVHVSCRSSVLSQFFSILHKEVPFFTLGMFISQFLFAATWVLVTVRMTLFKRDELQELSQAATKMAFEASLDDEEEVMGLVQGADHDDDEGLGRIV